MESRLTTFIVYIPLLSLFIIALLFAQLVKNVIDSKVS